MKKLVCLTIIILVLSTGTAFAAETVPAGIGPGSLFYWFDRLAERVELVFTLAPRGKVEALSRIGLERLSEAQEAESSETVSDLVSDYEEAQEEAQDAAADDVDALAFLSDSETEALEHLRDSDRAQQLIDKALARLDKLMEKLARIAAQDPENTSGKAARAISKTADRLAHIEDKLLRLGGESTETTGKHLVILEGVLDRAPDQARKGLENAISRSSETTTAAGNDNPTPQGPPEQRGGSGHKKANESRGRR